MGADATRVRAAAGRISLILSNRRSGAAPGRLPPPPARTHEDRLSWASFLPANLAGLWDARGPAAPEICILFIYLFYFAPFESIWLRSPPESDRVGVKRGPGTDLIPPPHQKTLQDFLLPSPRGISSGPGGFTAAPLEGFFPPFFSESRLAPSSGMVAAAQLRATPQRSSAFFAC